jgi:putative two-component system response regulator
MIKKEPYPDAKILIVDDETTSVRLLKKILTEAGYTNIYSTRDPDKVQKLYQSVKPDLLVLDLHMPHMEGFKIMDQLRAIEKDDYLPILVISQERNRVIQFSALEAGAKDFLVKPYDSIEVILRIRNFLEVRMLHKQIREQNKLLEQRVRERTEELYQTQIDVIQRLSRAVEYRDSETGTHTMRMAQYSYSLALALDMTPEECEVISTASSLHDVGKIGIPDRILQKPGKLTPEEWEIMKTHTTIGSELLAGSNSKFLKLGQEIALTHHEKWDGSGYPRGLKKEKIPLAGRICGLCDVFDALTSKRPYKEPWPIDDALKEIKQGAGQHFDPKLVEFFFQILPQIRRIHDQYGDS